MSIEIRIPKEIDDYREKWYFRRTKRELIWTILACCAALITTLFLYFVCWFTLSAALIPAFFVAIPFGIVGFYRPLGLPIEVYLLYYLDQTFGMRKFPYKTNLQKCAADENFPIRMNQMTKRERRDYARTLSKEDRRALKRQSERTCGRIDRADVGSE